MQAKRGFTLVEILIVVVILGILAAIVIPQFTQASSEAKLNSLCSDLQSIRSQIELYKIQHNDAVPAPEDGGATWDRMTETTTVGGVVNATAPTNVRTGDYQFGPYLERIPENPFNGLSSVSVITSGTGAATAGFGWVLNTTTGEIWAANTGDVPGDTTDSQTFQDL